MNGNITSSKLIELQSVVTPHSLGKLIEWKLPSAIVLSKGNTIPHSLGKQIEWKPPATITFLPDATDAFSPLAGETN
ncbi:hypothetical protein QUA20_02890 [Microcoleus sp. Pol7_A1]